MHPHDPIRVHGERLAARKNEPPIHLAAGIHDTLQPSPVHFAGDGTFAGQQHDGRNAAGRYRQIRQPAAEQHVKRKADERAGDAAAEEDEQVGGADLLPADQLDLIHLVDPLPADFRQVEQHQMPKILAATSSGT